MLTLNDLRALSVDWEAIQERETAMRHGITLSPPPPEAVATTERVRDPRTGQWVSPSGLTPETITYAPTPATAPEPKGISLGMKVILGLVLLGVGGLVWWKWRR